MKNTNKEGKSVLVFIFYPTIGLISTIVHVLINIKSFKIKANEKKVDKIYRLFLFFILGYLLIDSLWGFIASQKYPTLLYIITYFVFIFTNLTVVMWGFYVVKYLDEKGFFRKFFIYSGIVLLFIEIISLITNLFVPFLFWFDSDGFFHFSNIRTIFLVIQILIFGLSAIRCGIKAVKSQGALRIRQRAICFFGVTMVVAGIIQPFIPFFPVFSFGYLLGGCIIHIYVIEVEKEEANENNRKEQEEFQNQLMDALKKAEAANHAKSFFLFNMSHDIRTPMNAIIGYTELLEKYNNDAEKRINYLQKIKTSSNYLLDLINNVLEMSRIENGKIELDEEELNIPTFISDLGVVFEGEYEKRNLTINRIHKLEHTFVICDISKCREIFLNVLSNAVKYTPNGGTITITVVEEPSPKDGFIRIRSTIADNGIGMSKEFLPHLFDSFSREKTVTENKIIGTGLGMGIVKSLVDLMDGEVIVDSELGKGTSITVVLDLRKSDGQSLRSKSETKVQNFATSFSGKRLLLAEDNDLNAEIAESILEEAGFLVERAEDGIACVDMLEKANPKYYDAVLMDIQMPNMDGLKATKIIRRLNDKDKAAVPIIAMTANAFEDDHRNVIEAGMDGFITKPIDIPKLMDTLASFVTKSE